MRIFQKGFNFSQDGPGNRLVYHLQGCNLRCPWCSNPEGLSLSGGEDVTLDALADEVERSRLMFFDGGGVTLTGGEATIQFDEVRSFLELLHRKGINTCIETNGISKRLPELFPFLDLLIMDIKHYDGRIHRKVTGASNRNAIRNVTEARAAGQKTALRIPLIGGFNASPEDAEAFRDLFISLDVPSFATVELLAYHEFDRSKYDALGIDYTMTGEARVSADKIRLFQQTFEAAGITVIHT